MSRTFNAKIVMNDRLEYFYEEDIVKQSWSYLVPFFRRGEGIEKGEIFLEDGAIIISWSWEDEYEDTYTEGEVGWYEAHKLEGPDTP
jgi:hypothetical protein